MIKDYPTVFLSHSSKDSEIVERLAIDLRKHRIHAWYADWEIPSGSSLRRKIFEQGIDACDAFLVYLTEHAMNSNWVQEEMDSGFINLIEKQCLFLPIVDNYEVIRVSHRFLCTHSSHSLTSRLLWNNLLSCFA